MLYYLDWKVKAVGKNLAQDCDLKLKYVRWEMINSWIYDLLLPNSLFDLNLSPIPKPVALATFWVGSG